MPIKILRTYFASGWLFFLPYLVLYLGFLIADGSVTTAFLVFGILHLAHLIGLAMVLWKTSWPAKPTLVFFAAICFIFLIQGAYIEFPSDAWSHVGRIFGWTTVDSFSAELYYAKYKSAFFLAASWLHWLPLSWRFAGLGIYSATLATLFVYQLWKFYLLIGLPKFPASFATVAAMLFLGTPLQYQFYYAYSSNLPSMIGVLAGIQALIRFHGSPSPRKWLPAMLLPAALFLIGLNHIEGFGMLILGFLAVSCWHFQQRFGNLRFFSFLVSFAILGLAMAWLAIGRSEWGSHFWRELSGLRGEGWLTPWGAIPFWRFGGLGGDGPATRFLEVITWSGLANLIAAAWLVWRGKVIGWITLIPVFALLYPVSATLLAWFHSTYDVILTFHRYLLMALPLGALISVIYDVFVGKGANLIPKTARARTALTCLAFLLLVGTAFPEQRHWLGKWRDFGDHRASMNQAGFLRPLQEWMEKNPKISAVRPKWDSDPITANYLWMNFGGSVNHGRLDVNDRLNTLFGNIPALRAQLSVEHLRINPTCVLALAQNPSLPLYYSWAGQVSRHWPSFAINETFQFDPATLAWCDKNLTPDRGWEIFDAPPWYRVYFHPKLEDAPEP